MAKKRIRYGEKPALKPIPSLCFVSRTQFHEARDILGRDLDPERCPQSIGAERAQVFVEIS